MTPSTSRRSTSGQARPAKAPADRKQRRGQAGRSDRPPAAGAPTTTTASTSTTRTASACRSCSPAPGVGSRRVCENLITAGRVSVDGHVVTELGVRIDPARQRVHVDGERVQLDESPRLPGLPQAASGCVSTMSDERGRPSIGDYVGGRSERLFHVGRLDADTEGLLLLTNDGELAHRLPHPAYEVLKTYVAQVPGPVPRDLGRRLRAGVELDDGPVAVDSFRVLDSAPGKALVEVVLHEGRKHIVRRLLAAVGHPVQSLVRTQVGPIELGALGPGKTRRLTRQEVGRLYAAAGL